MDIEQLAGTKLGNYEIESLLGSDEWGAVYKARQISLNRPVALKILPPTLCSDSSFIKRFHRDANTVARLSHPGIVQVHDFGKEQGLHFYSMEYVEGQTLGDLLRDTGRLDIDEVVRIIRQAAHGIEHAHRNGVIHREIKPSNIIIDESGNVKVTGFGLAKIVAWSPIPRGGGPIMMMGDVAYLSPEQEFASRIDYRTDIWSLGVVLYRMLTGKLPFDDPSETGPIRKMRYENPGIRRLRKDARRLYPQARLLYELRHEEPWPIVNHRDDLPAALEQVVGKMLQKDPQKRYQDMEALISDLGRRGITH